MTYQRPMVGVAVFIIKDDSILLGKRKNAHGAGTWATPGGHLEYGESLEECALREVQEETGLVIRNVRPATFTNDIFLNEHKHYITLYMIADYNEGTPQILEPEKCEEWRWFTREQLPTPLFLCIHNLLVQLTQPYYPGKDLLKSFL